MIFRPDIKPPQWGPPDAIQYAIMVNAERMGIDCTRVTWVLAAWEGVGRPALYSTYRRFSVASAVNEAAITWLPERQLRLNKAYYVLNDTISGSVGEFSLVGRLKRSTVGLDDEGIVSDMRVANWEGTGFSVIARKASLPALRFVVNGATTDTSGVQYLAAGVERSLGFVFKGGEKQNIFVDGFERAYGTRNIAASYTESPYPMIIGTYYDGVTARRPDMAVSTMTLFSTAVSDSAVGLFHETPYALLMPVSRPVYFDLGAGGGTLTTDSAWEIYTAAEIDTAWAIRAALSQSASWAVFTRADADSAWSIRTSSQSETSWTVRADLETETSWPIATAADTPTEWRIKAGVDTETAWPIFTAVDTATAWAILNSLALETPTAWSIRNALAADAAWSIRTALDTGSAWAILSRLDRETAWQILGAGILDTPTAWAIRADLDQSTAWTIKTSLDADTDWTIINGMDTATAWDILQGFATDTAWQVYRGLDTATAWSIISDMVPEPVRVFMAEPRDFIINAEKRIFILLAERK